MMHVEGMTGIVALIPLLPLVPALLAEIHTFAGCTFVPGQDTLTPSK